MALETFTENLTCRHCNNLSAMKINTMRTVLKILCLLQVCGNCASLQQTLTRQMMFVALDFPNMENRNAYKQLQMSFIQIHMYM